MTRLRPLLLPGPLLVNVIVAATLTLACSSDDAGTAKDGVGDGGSGGSGNTRTYVDPGTAEWQPVPRDQVAEVCKLDPDVLDQIDAELNLQWGIIRYGRLCHEFYPQGASQMELPQQNWSATKTLGATVVGVAVQQTKNLPKTGPKTGPVSDLDRADYWLDSFTFNRDARLSHMLGMVGHNPSLAWGEKAFAYDTVGTVQINRLSDVITAAIQQDTTRFGSTLEAFTQKFLFGPLGMRHSTWTEGLPDKNFAFSWYSPLRDMMRLGLLILNDGQWSGQQIVDPDYLYRMIHPSFEDASTGYGYLTWLAPRNSFAGACVPDTIHSKYPHGLSEATDCNGLAGGNPTTFDCSQPHDVGLWSANGLNGQLIFGTKALDIVIVVKELGQYTPPGAAAPLGLASTYNQLWPLVRPAIVALDPTHAGNDAAFCEAFDKNAYAPDLK